MLSLVVRLWLHLRSKRRNQIFLIFVFMFFAAFAEIMSIGAIIPFLAILTQPNEIFEYEWIRVFAGSVGVQKADELIIPFTIFFAIFALFSGVIRLSLLVFVTKISFSLGTEIGREMYKRTLYQSYEAHAQIKSSELVNGIVKKSNVIIHSVFISVLNIMNSAIMLITVAATFILLQPQVAIITILGFVTIYGLIIFLTRKKLEENSKVIASESTLIIKMLQEGLGSIRDVIVNNTQELYIDVFHKSDKKLRRAERESYIVAATPKFFIETVFMLSIAGLAYFFHQIGDGLVSSIPMLGAMALGAQRLLPIFQQGYSSLSQIKAGKESLNDVLRLLDQVPNLERQTKNANRLNFSKIINLKKVTFNYPGSDQYILKDIDMEIKKGDRIGVIGKTGSGKTTLLDIVIGLLGPSGGHVYIDGKKLNKRNVASWRAKIAHVPQNIFLSDNSLAENIAHGVKFKNIEMDRIKQIISDTKLSGLVDSWPEGLGTVLGERGSILSGGQKQRIAIARALYKQAEVIVFDEATSALDSKTENEIMKVINSLPTDVTVIIIAHRLSTLDSCDIIFEVTNKKIKKLKKHP